MDKYLLDLIKDVFRDAIWKASQDARSVVLGYAFGEINAGKNRDYSEYKLFIEEVESKLLKALEE